MSKVNFKKLILLFPFLFLLHDIEEIVTVEKFLRAHSDIIPFRVTTYQFALAFLILWVVTTIGCLQASRNKRFLGFEPVTFFSLLVPGILLANGAGHVIQFLFFGEYVPGIITTIMIIFPYSYIALSYLLKEHFITMKRFSFFLLFGFILQGPFALSALLLSKFALK